MRSLEEMRAENEDLLMEGTWTGNAESSLTIDEALYLLDTIDEAQSLLALCKQEQGAFI